MMKNIMTIGICLGFIILIVNPLLGQDRTKKKENFIWTYTYLKANENQKRNLKVFLEKNWFYLDSIAVAQGVFNNYELIENTNENTQDWDYIVAVEYFTEGGYTDEVAEKFQKIRKDYGKPVLINGLGMKELGKIIKSENVKRHTYPPKEN